MKLIRKITALFISLILLTLWSCKPIKTALELNNKKYSKIVDLQNSTINTEGVYVFKNTLVSGNGDVKKETVTEFIKFNDNKTVQFSSKHSSIDNKEQISNKNITTWLNDYTSSFYYTKNNSKLVVEHYISNPNQKSWYALDGPASAPLKFKIMFKINGDTLVKKNKKYILDKTLTNNHKNITTDFITLNN